MIREAGVDYRKAVVAVAIAGGVAVTVAGAGWLAYRLWRRRSCHAAATTTTKSERETPSVPPPTATASRSGRPEATKPTPSREHLAGSVVAPSPSQPMGTDLLSTSGTFEKVPSPAPESFEQLTMSQMQQSRVVTPPSSVSQPSSDSAMKSHQPSVPLAKPSEPSVETAPSHPSLPSASSAPVSAAGDMGKHSGQMHMKEKNDIVLIETNSSSGSDDAETAVKTPASESSAAPQSSDTALSTDILSQAVEQPSIASEAGPTMAQST